MVSKHFPTKHLLITKEKRVTQEVADRPKVSDTVKNYQAVLFRHVWIPHVTLLIMAKTWTQPKFLSAVNGKQMRRSHAEHC